MKLHLQLIILFILARLLVPSTAIGQSADEPAVRAILFFSPACPHCHHVINELLIPMVEDYGDQLQIAGFDTSQPEGAQFYQIAIEHYQIPHGRQGVPTLIVGDVILVGSGEIPEQFPTLVEEGLASGGIDWPDIPGLNPVLPTEAEPEPSPQPTVTSSSTPLPQTLATPISTILAQATATAALRPTSTPVSAVLVSDDAALPPTEIEASPPDPVGFGLAGLVLIVMVAALGYAVWRIATTRQRLFELDRNPATFAGSWVISLLSLAGLGVAIYLAYVEITQVEAICGPVGECNLVQSSPYAQILGIPVAVLGVLSYLAIGLLWAGQKYFGGWVANLSVLGLLGLTIIGTLFSIYLTLLELFVIDAVCVWCLSSAVITTILLLLVVIPVTGNFSPAGVPAFREKARI